MTGENLERQSLLGDVSRETMDTLSAYVALLEKWNERINLVSKRSVGEIWNRHVADSAQLIEHVPSSAREWLDMGSGAGLPGVVIAIQARERLPDLHVTMIEADSRKAAFLEAVSRDLGLGFKVVVARVEVSPPLEADVISARALAPLARLLAYAERHRKPDTVCLFPKGRGHVQELAEARRIWTVEPDIIPSRTDPEGVILRIGDFRRA